MIYTCTLNPSLDYYLDFDHDIEAEKTNRSVNEYYQAGGKGVNVSIVLSNLSIPSKCLGFLGGFNSDFYIELLANYPYVQPLFSIISASTRINVKIQDLKNEYIFNAIGPKIKDNELEVFLRRIKRIARNDILVISGSIQDELDKVVYDAVKTLEDGVDFILDTKLNLTKELLKFKPLLIKPNLEELAVLVGREVEGEEDIINACKDLIAKGAQSVICSAGQSGSYFVSKDNSYYCKGISKDIVNTTGAGDSMIAGFIFNYQRGGNDYENFRFANACSHATTISPTLGNKEEIYRCLDILEISEL